jgi:hypothetical protein
VYHSITIASSYPYGSLFCFTGRTVIGLLLLLGCRDKWHSALRCCNLQGMHDWDSAGRCRSAQHRRQWPGGAGPIADHSTFLICWQVIPCGADDSPDDQEVCRPITSSIRIWKTAVLILGL